MRSFHKKMIFSFLFVSIYIFINQALASPLSPKFFALSDIHFDPFTFCQKNTACSVIQKLEVLPSQKWGAVLAKEETQAPQYKQDSNYSFLENTLIELKKTAGVEKPEFVIILGDFIGHGFKDKYAEFATDKSDLGYQSFVKKTMEFVLGEIKKTFTTTNVFIAFGNNDSYLEDYVFDSSSFYHDMSLLGGNLIQDKSSKAEMQNTSRKSGYYAVNIPSFPKLRLIVLNSNLFSYLAKGSDLNGMANDEINWLKKELEKAKETHQKVILMMHVPATIDVYASLNQTPFKPIALWRTEYNDQFEELLNQYSSIISAMFGSHFHRDWFQVLTFKNSHSISVSGIPSISPIYKNNPGFKIFSFNKDSLELENYEKIIYPLDRQEWIKEYNFNDVYQPQCQHCKLINGMNLLKSSGELAKQYSLFFDAEAHQDSINIYFSPYYWCQIHSITVPEYQTCLDNTPRL